MTSAQNGKSLICGELKVVSLRVSLICLRFDNPFLRVQANSSFFISNKAESILLRKMPLCFLAFIFKGRLFFKDQIKGRKLSDIKFSTQFLLKAEYKTL